MSASILVVDDEPDVADLFLPALSLRYGGLGHVASPAANRRPDMNNSRSSGLR
jgi:hypothetical protein